MQKAHNAFVRSLPDAELLLTLLAVAEAGSESEASAVLGIGQSSVSRRLAALQEGVAEPLTQRTAGGLKVTSAGERLLPHAREVRAALVAAGRALGSGAGPHELRLGLSSHLAPRFAGPLIVAARAEPAGPSVTLLEGASRQLLLQVQSGALLAALTLWAPAGAEPGYTAERVETDRLTCVALSGNPAVRGGELQVTELRDQSVLLPAEDSVVTARARALLKRHGTVAAATVSVGSGAAVRSAALAGAGVGVTLASASAGDVAAGWLAAAPFPLPDGAVDVWLLLSDALDGLAATQVRALVGAAVTATATA
jgi:DNA-binding transcriptional LysR family regulator